MCLDTHIVEVIQDQNPFCDTHWLIILLKRAFCFTSIFVSKFQPGFRELYCTNEKAHQLISTMQILMMDGAASLMSQTHC